MCDVIKYTKIHKCCILRLMFDNIHILRIMFIMFDNIQSHAVRIIQHQLSAGKGATQYTILENSMGIFFCTKAH